MHPVLPLLAVLAVSPADTLRVSALVEHTRFDETFDPWTVGSVELSASGNAGTLVGRVNAAERFGRSGVQLEADAYPALGDGRYAYLNVGVSGEDVFPRTRFGAELYSPLGGAWEGSLGMRHLRFDATTVTLWTGSAALYRGNWWYAVRPFVKPEDGDVAVSASFSGRRYGADRWDYWGFRVGVGASAAGADIDQALRRDNSFTAALEGRRPLARDWTGLWEVEWAWEEVGPDDTRQRVAVDLGLSWVARR